MPDATALAAAIRAGRTTARAVMEASLAACDAQAELGAVAHIDRAMALADGETGDQGPFGGVPFLAKDLGSVARGLPIAAGSAALRKTARAAENDSDLFAAFQRAGLVPFGVSAVPPFGLSLSCEPEGVAPSRNPWNRALTPGGSSGGAAAAVAGGIVAIAHATDAAGSIRVPAACCGLTGLKPSRGAIPGGPSFDNHLAGIASELVLARSVRDVSAAFDAVHILPARTALPDVPRIGLALPDRCDATQQDAARFTCAALRDAGCHVQQVPAPDALGQQASGIATKILAASLAEWFLAAEIDDAEVPTLAAAMADKGRRMPASELFAAIREMAQVSDTVRNLFDDLDAIVMPVLAHAPPPVGAFDFVGTDPVAHSARLEAFAPNAVLANVAGLPALALPFGMADGLPVGVQVVGPPGSDHAVLELGKMIEAQAPDLSFPHPIAGLAA